MHIAKMGIRTRSATSSPMKASTGRSQPSANSELPSQQVTKILIAPQSISSESRVIQLRHPRDEHMSQFLFCPDSGLYEFTKINAQEIEPRSIMFCFANMDEYDSKTMPALDGRISHGFVTENAEILVTTPFDITFILLRKLAPEDTSSKKAMFQPLDDLLDNPESGDGHLRYILKNASSVVEAAMLNICDVADVGDEKLYRYSEKKVFRFWLDRANQVVNRGLPASLEEHFVTRPLETPVLSIKREESAVVTSLPLEESQTSTVEDNDSQSTVPSTTASVAFSEVSEVSSVTIVAEDSPRSDIPRLLRLRVALNFISATCLPKQVTSRLRDRLVSDGSPISFKPLDDELLRISSMRTEALASRSLTDFSRKRTLGDDEEVLELRAEKKRRLEEEEKKRKANESRGVRDLKKVNISGMKKMSDFFSKKPVNAKAKT